MEARRNMLHASFYAGCAFTKSYVGYVHAIAHSLGGEYNVPHGLANAVILPMMLEAYGEKTVPVLMNAAELEPFYYRLMDTGENDEDKEVQERRD